MIVMVFILGFIYPSFVRGMLIPMLIGWNRHDRFWTSPQAATIYLTLPFKCRPGFPFSFW